MVKSLLELYVPESEVWAYGSRVTGGYYEASDLDLVVLNPLDLTQETVGTARLKEAFMESDLPIRVDVLDWARIPQSFHTGIERAYVIIQEGHKES
jgi:predicted nucleotidyltransferase